MASGGGFSKGSLITFSMLYPASQLAGNHLMGVELRTIKSVLLRYSAALNVQHRQAQSFNQSINDKRPYLCED